MTIKDFENYVENGWEKKYIKRRFIRENIFGLIWRIILGFILWYVLNDISSFGGSGLSWKIDTITCIGVVCAPIGWHWIRSKVSLFFELNIFNIGLLAVISMLLGFALLPFQVIENAKLWREIYSLKE